MPDCGSIWRGVTILHGVNLQVIDQQNLKDDETDSIPEDFSNSIQCNARVNILGVGVTAGDMESAIEFLLNARSNGARGYVCVTSVHGVIESQRDSDLLAIHNRSLMTVPDGMPLVWMGREQGFVHMGRVYGPDLMKNVVKASAHHNHSIEGQLKHRQLTHFLYGATPQTLEKLKANLEKAYPGVQITGTYAPPFRPLNEDEEVELRNLVAACKPDFLWVGLSTPKQERFMAAHTYGAEHELDCGIMLGVGAAFDIHAGDLKDAPGWVKGSGLQWLYRLCQEPRRLWRRYLDIVPNFLFLTALQLLGVRKYNTLG
jgi:N-acetylglucosaminyldiphosphoundecaprenol N-acetyl-beta-D-mannosaminyltransferase